MSNGNRSVTSEDLRAAKFNAEDIVLCAEAVLIYAHGDSAAPADADRAMNRGERFEYELNELKRLVRAHGSSIDRVESVIHAVAPFSEFGCVTASTMHGAVMAGARAICGWKYPIEKTREVLASMKIPNTATVLMTLVNERNQTERWILRGATNKRTASQNSYYVYEIKGMTKYSNERLRHYAKKAGIPTAGRGDKNFKWITSDVVKLLHCMLENNISRKNRKFVEESLERINPNQG